MNNLQLTKPANSIVCPQLRVTRRIPIYYLLALAVSAFTGCGYLKGKEDPSGNPLGGAGNNFGHDGPKTGLKGNPNPRTHTPPPVPAGNDAGRVMLVDQGLAFVVVEIVGSKAQTPSPTWERFVATGKARSAIRRYFRAQQRDQFSDLGRAIVQKAFRQAGQAFDEEPLLKAMTHFRYKSVDDLYVAAGEGIVTGHQVIAKAFPDVKVKQAKAVSLTRRRSKRGKPDEHAFPIRGLIPGMAMHFAVCCHPLPGDRIVGIVTTGKGVTIHTIDCETLETFTDSPERWLDVSWDTDNEDQDGHLGRIVVVVNNEPGGLGTLSMVIAKNQGNISNLKITNRSVEFFEMIVDIEVQDVKHLTNIIAALRTTPVISSVERARG